MNLFSIIRHGLFVLFVTFPFAIPAQQTAPAQDSLSSLILDLHEFKMLSVEDQMKYLIWSRELLAVLEILQGEGKTEKLASFQRTKDWSIELSIFPQADAALPLVPLYFILRGASLVVRSPPVVRFASQAKNYTDVAWRTANTSRLQKGSSLTAIGSKQAGRAKMDAAVIAGSSVATVAAVSAGRGSEGAENSDKKPAESGQTANLAGEYREVTAKCLFGGHLSQFKKFGDKILCTRPKASINSKICKDPKNSFLCQSFGLSQGPSPSDLSSKLCVPLLNQDGSLVDLTPRCTAAFRQMMVEGPTMIGIDNFNKSTAALKTSAEQFEKEKMKGEITFQEYCKDQNAINKEIQKSECEALTGLISLLKQGTQIEKVIAQRKNKGRGPYKPPASSTPGTI